MSNIWFTADSHFGHANIIKYSKRPFDSVHDHDRCLQRNWNKVVRSNHTVYHLGDFCFHNDPEDVLKFLYGAKHLFIGNHDYHGKSIRNVKGFRSVPKT